MVSGARGLAAAPEGGWGLLLGYNLVRFEMERAAERIGLPPTRISYRNALLVLRLF